MRLFISLLSITLLLSLADARAPKGCPNGLPTLNAPTYSPPPGTYVGTQTVAINCPAGATCHYTTDGSLPNPSSTTYSTPLTVAVTETIRAIATEIGWNQSVPSGGLYTISAMPAATAPSISPGTGTYTSARTVSITCTTPGCAVYYTIDGTTPQYPVGGSSTVLYTGTFVVASGTETVQALAEATGYTNSSVSTSVITISAGLAACSNTTGVTAGALTLRATVTRTTGIWPLYVGLDATATTDTSIPANTTSFTDDWYAWDFGDAGPSGTGTWANGSSPGKHSKNAAIGAVAGHVYFQTDGSGDNTYTPQVTATDAAGNTIGCTLSVTALDPNGTNGFPGSATTCFYNSTVGTGCPSGATQTSTGAWTSALPNAAGHRYLFKCGDTFTGDNNVSSQWIKNNGGTIGAYGACEYGASTSPARPIFNDTGTNGVFYALLNPSGGGVVSDIRIHDIDYEAASTGGPFMGTFCQGAGCGPGTPTSVPNSPSQFTYFNNTANNAPSGFGSMGWCAQCAWVSNTYVGVAGAHSIGIVMNNHECLPGTVSPTALYCGAGSYVQSNYFNVDHNAFINNNLNGNLPVSGNGIETLRIGAGVAGVIADNTLQNSNYAGGGANLKLHSANHQDQATWSGEYTQWMVVTGDLIQGASGSQAMELAPQNWSFDERLRYNLIDGILVSSTTAGSDALLWLDSSYSAVRNSVFYQPSTATHAEIAGIRGEARLISGGTSPVYNEIYNNTCYFKVFVNYQYCVWMQAVSGQGGPQMEYSSLINNMFHAISNIGGTTAIRDVLGTATSHNTISNNSSAPTDDPAPVNASGTLLQMSDWQPTAFYSGGTSVPNLYDALGTAWSPTWDLGAVHP